MKKPVECVCSANVRIVGVYARELLITFRSRCFNCPSLCQNAFKATEIVYFYFHVLFPFQFCVASQNSVEPTPFVVTVCVPHFPLERVAHTCSKLFS